MKDKNMKDKKQCTLDIPHVNTFKKLQRRSSHNKSLQTLRNITNELIKNLHNGNLRIVKVDEERISKYKFKVYLRYIKRIFEPYGYTVVTKLGLNRFDPNGPFAAIYFRLITGNEEE